jgi:hypothetical protein
VRQALTHLDSQSDQFVEGFHQLQRLVRDYDCIPPAVYVSGKVVQMEQLSQTTLSDVFKASLGPKKVLVSLKLLRVLKQDNASVRKVKLRRDSGIKILIQFYRPASEKRSYGDTSNTPILFYFLGSHPSFRLASYTNGHLKLQSLRISKRTQP